MALKTFTEVDVVKHGGGYERIYCDRNELLYDSPAWMKRGLQETVSGYGARLNSGRKINFLGKLYRLYITNYGNSGSTWFKVKGRKIFVD